MTRATGKEDAYKLRLGCPECGRVPNVRFAESEVARARRERQAARLQSHRCTRCGVVFWIQARDVAAAALDRGKRRAQRST